MSFPIAYLNTVTVPQGGTNVFTGSGQDYRFTLSSIGMGSEVTIILTSQQTGQQLQIGAGNVTGISPVYTFVFNNKAYVLAGNTVYFSAVNQPTLWNDPNGTGNSYLTLGDYFGSPQNLVAAAPYQGKLVFFARYSAQIWVTNADPTQWSLAQILQNIGTNAPLSVQNMGDLDVLFLADSGIRSLRVRDSSLNAFVNDMGSPVDALITALNGNNSAACGIIEPTSGRYWCFIQGTIFVFSYFPTNKILAWGTYLPTYQSTMYASATTYPVGLTVTYTVTVGYKYHWTKGANDVSITDGTTTLKASGYIVPVGTTLTMTGTANTAAVTATLYEATPFTPTKFVTLAGRVYCRDANQFYLYGGASGTLYDYAQGIAATTWLDMDKPGTLKKAKGLDSAFNGNFNLALGMDYQSEVLKSMYAGSQVTFQKGGIDCSTDGFHVQLQVSTLDNNAASMASLVFHYELGQEK